MSEDERVESEHARNQQGSAQSYHQVEQQEGDHPQSAGRQDGEDAPVEQQPERHFIVLAKEVVNLPVFFGELAHQAIAGEVGEERQRQDP